MYCMHVCVWRESARARARERASERASERERGLSAAQRLTPAAAGERTPSPQLQHVTRPSTKPSPQIPYLDCPRQFLLAGGSGVRVAHQRLGSGFELQPLGITPLELHSQPPGFLVPPSCRRVRTLSGCLPLRLPGAVIGLYV